MPFAQLFLEKALENPSAKEWLAFSYRIYHEKLNSWRSGLNLKTGNQKTRSFERHDWIHEILELLRSMLPAELLDEEDFVFFMRSGAFPPGIWKKLHPSKREWIKPPSYQKGPGHKPKTYSASDLAGKFWRNKYFLRDKARHGWPRFSSERRQFWRKKGARRHRKWAKILISQERFDELSVMNESWKKHNDPWDWD